MADDPAPLLRGPGQEAGHVDEGDERDVERVAGAHEPRRLDGGVDVEHARERARLVADDADRVAAEAREAAHDVLGPVRLHLEELPVVDDALDDALACRTAGAGCPGSIVSSAGSSRSTGSDGGAKDGASRLFCGRNESR